MNKLNWHILVSAIVLAMVSAAMAYMKVDGQVIGIVTALVSSGLVMVGFLHVTDQGTVNDLQARLSTQIMSSMQAAKDIENLMVLHQANAANIAQVAQTTAVHAALIQAPAPPPLVTAPVAVPSVSTSNSSEPHLVP